MDMAHASKVFVGAAGGAPGARRRWQRGEVGSHQDLLAFGDQSANLAELAAPELAQIGTAYLKDENSYVRSEDAYVEMRARKVDFLLQHGTVVSEVGP